MFNPYVLSFNTVPLSFWRGPKWKFWSVLFSWQSGTFTWPQPRVVEVIQLELLCNEPSSNVHNDAITQQCVSVHDGCSCVHAVWHNLHATYVLPPPPLANSTFDLLWKNSTGDDLSHQEVRYRGIFEFCSDSYTRYLKLLRCVLPHHDKRYIRQFDVIKIGSKNIFLIYVFNVFFKIV